MTAKGAEMSSRTLPRLQTTHEWAREEIRHRIVSGLYAPGALLKQTEIAEELDISVTPVREAMRDLVGEGLVTMKSQRIAHVCDADPDAAVEINEMRLLLEPLAARRAAERAAAADVLRMRELAAVAEEAAVAMDHAGWVSGNHEFHVAIIDSARSPRLAATLRNLRQISTFYLGIAVRENRAILGKGIEEHRALIDAIEARDGERAAAIMRHHLLPSASVAAHAALSPR